MEKQVLFRQDGCLFRVLFAPYVFLCFCFLVVCKVSVFIKQIQEARRIFRQPWERLGNTSEMDEEKLSSWPSRF